MNASGGVLPTLIDEQQLIESENEDWVSKSSTVVRIAQMPSLPTSHEEEDSTGKYSAEDQILEQGGLSSSASGEAKLMCCGKLKKPTSAIYAGPAFAIAPSLPRRSRGMVRLVS